jgi:Ser-tRNA(Ala) deacylase AlaX
MPDGGVHVRSTAEIGEVVIHSITQADGHSIIRYGVAGQVQS